MASASTSTTPLWKLEVEREAKSGYYVVIPDSFERLRDPFVAPYLRKWLVLNSVLMHLQMGATPVLLYPLGLDFRTNAAVLGLYGGSFYLAMSVGGAFAGYMFRRFRIAQTLTVCVSGAAASSMFTATLPTSSGKSVMVLVVLRVIFGLCQAIIMAHSLLWARRTAPRDRTKAWLTVFQFAIPVGILLGYSVAAAVATGFDFKFDALEPPAHWRLVFVIQSIVLIPFAWLFWNLPDEQLAVFPWAASSSNFTPEGSSSQPGYGATGFPDSSESYREAVDNDAASMMESSMVPTRPTSNLKNSTEIPPSAPAADDRAQNDETSSLLSAGTEVCYVTKSGAHVHGVIVESKGQRICVAPSALNILQQDEADPATPVPSIPRTTDRSLAVVADSSAIVAAPDEKIDSLPDEIATVEGEKVIATREESPEDRVNRRPSQDDDFSRAIPDDLPAPEILAKALTSEKPHLADGLTNQALSPSPESAEEASHGSAPADLPSPIAASDSSIAADSSPLLQSHGENQKKNVPEEVEEDSPITNDTKEAPTVDPGDDDASNQTSTTENGMPPPEVTESVLNDHTLTSNSNEALLTGASKSFDPSMNVSDDVALTSHSEKCIPDASRSLDQSTALEAQKMAACTDDVSLPSTASANKLPSQMKPCWVDEASVVRVISPVVNKTDAAESAISPTVGTSGSNASANLTFFSPITAGAQLPDTPAVASPPCSHVSNPSNAPRVSPAEALAAAALSQRRPRSATWREDRSRSSSRRGHLGAPTTAPTGHALNLESAGAGEPRTEADAAAAAAAVAVRAAAASTVAAGAAAGASVMAHVRGIIALQTTLLHIPNYAPLLGALCAVYFVATGLQFYSTSYLLIGLGLPPITAYMYVVLVLATAPTMGVAAGSFFVQALEWLGGFRGRKRLASLRRCGYLALLVAAVSSLSLLYPHLTLGQEVGRLWATAFLCAALLPTLSELLASAVPRELKRQSGSSVHILVKNILAG